MKLNTARHRTAAKWRGQSSSRRHWPAPRPPPRVPRRAEPAAATHSRVAHRPPSRCQPAIPVEGVARVPVHTRAVCHELLLPIGKGTNFAGFCVSELGERREARGAIPLLRVAPSVCAPGRPPLCSALNVMCPSRALESWRNRVIKKKRY